MIVKTSSSQKGFTLIELLVVIAILGLLAAVSVPALSSMKRADASVAAIRQLLDDVGRARQLAISRHTDVYMIFCPAGFWSDPNYDSAINTLPAAQQSNERAKGSKLWDKQLTGYTFVTLRNVGEQPGVATPDYVGPWHTLPENTFIATSKFVSRNTNPNTFTKITDLNGRSYDVYGFSYTNGIPFPSEDAYDPAVPNKRFAWLPYLKFNYLGQLVSPGDEYIPLARGTVAHSRDKDLASRQGLPELIEKPPGNSTNAFNLIHIDRLTGRARLIHQEITGF